MIGEYGLEAEGALPGSIESRSQLVPTARGDRRNDIVLGIGYGDDIDRAIEVANGILDKDDRVLCDPAPVVAVTELADSSVNLIVRPWCAKEDYWDLRFDLNRTFKEQLEAAGCSIPFPQRDVHVHQVNGAATGQ